ncbi:MAG: DUF4810 domain-containing protein [Methylobacter sp.]
MESIFRKLIASRLRTGIPAMCCLIIVGCAGTGPLYYWGEYDDLVYKMYVKPGEADTATQVEKLQADIAKASEAGARIGPGVHAHLGYMHFLQGNTQAAVHEFETEKALFPESAIFVDGLIGRLKK